MTPYSKRGPSPMNQTTDTDVEINGALPVFIFGRLVSSHIIHASSHDWPKSCSISLKKSTRTFWKVRNIKSWFSLVSPYISLGRLLHKGSSTTSGVACLKVTVLNDSRVGPSRSFTKERSGQWQHLRKLTTSFAELRKEKKLRSKGVHQRVVVLVVVFLFWFGG